MLLSRAKPAAESASRGAVRKRKEIPTLNAFLDKRDYVGAITLLEFLKSSGKPEPDTEKWLGYCFFHTHMFQKALDIYLKILFPTLKAASVLDDLKNGRPPHSSSQGVDGDVWTSVCCCLYMMGMYKETDEASKHAPDSPLKNRIMFHLSHKFNDEERLMGHHRQLNDVNEDQLTLASIHYLRSHYQEAIDIYKRILMDHRDYLALNVYIALCYYKLDYYDVSQEVLKHYLESFPDSATAINLKACNHFRLYSGKNAETELEALSELTSSSFEYAQELIKHNMVVFKGGEKALQVLYPLIDVLPEARLNLVIYFLREDELQEAFNLLKDLEPTTPQEYILKGVVNAALGQEQDSTEHLKIAQQYFQLVGGSASECDTIPGRQCMASCFFLLKQFDDVLIYLDSIKSYFYNDDTFNFDYGQCLASLSRWKDAEDAFLLIQSDRIKSDYTYLSWLARCYIMNRKSRLAWELYLTMDTSSESYNLLNLIANDCYKMGQFYYSCKAFDLLEHMDPNPEYWEGKRGACIGLFQQIIAENEPKETLREVLQILKTTQSPQVEYIMRTMKRWAKDNRVPIN